MTGGYRFLAAQEEYEEGRREDENLGQLEPRTVEPGGSGSPWSKRGGLESGGEGPL